MRAELGTCLVFGGAGWTGRALVEQLRRAGAPTLVADLRPHPELPSRICDVGDPGAVERVFAEVRPSTVFHLAAMIDIRPVPDPRLEAVNVGGTRSILAAARRHGTRRLIYTSSIDVVWGGAPMHRLDERTPYPPRYPHRYAASKAAAEREVLAANDASLQTVALRPAHIFGPGDDVLSLVGNVPLRFGPRSAHMSFVYVDNAAHAHVLAARSLARNPNTCAGQPFFIVDFDANFYDTYRALAGRAPTRVQIPSRSLRWLTTRSDALVRFADARLRVQVFRHPKRALSFAAVQAAEASTVDGRRAIEAFAYAPLVPRDEAFAHTQRWARSVASAGAMMPR